MVIDNQYAHDIKANNSVLISLFSLVLKIEFYSSTFIEIAFDFQIAAKVSGPFLHDGQTKVLAYGEGIALFEQNILLLNGHQPLPMWI